MDVLLCTIAFRENLLEHALYVAGDAGFDGVELWGREPHLPEKYDETRLRATSELIDKSGVQASVLGSYLRFGSTNADPEIKLRDVLHIAHWLKTPIVRVWASDVSSAEATQQIWDNTVQEAQEACDRAKKLGIRFVAEMHGGTLADTGETAKRLVQQVDRDNFALNFQIAARDRDETPYERLQTVLPWVEHFHAQNYASVATEPGESVQRVPLSSGVASYPKLVGTLDDAGYDGNIAVEFAHDGADNKAEGLAADLEFLRALSSD